MMDTHLPSEGITQALYSLKQREHSAVNAMLSSQNG